MSNKVLHRDIGDLVLRSDGDGRTVHGVVVPYNQTTTIHDSEGEYEERFLPGAFARSISQRGSKVRLLVNHLARERLPIGKATLLREDAAGLYAEFQVSKTRDGDEALTLIQDGVVDGFSVGFLPIRQRRGEDHAVERVEAALREVSVVAFPAYEGAAIAGVRSIDPRSLAGEVALLELAQYKAKIRKVHQ